MMKKNQKRRRRVSFLRNGYWIRWAEFIRIEVAFFRSESSKAQESLFYCELRSSSSRGFRDWRAGKSNLKPDKSAVLSIDEAIGLTLYMSIIFDVVFEKVNMRQSVSNQFSIYKKRIQIDKAQQPSIPVPPAPGELYVYTLIENQIARQNNRRCGCLHGVPR